MRLDDNAHEWLKKIVEATPGFVGADLSSLVTEAAMISVQNFRKDHADTKLGPFDSTVLDSLKVTEKDFLEALKSVSPSSMRDSVQKITPGTWNSIKGMRDLKDKLERMVVNPIKYSDLFLKYGTKASKGVLLYGPPGGGKTLLVSGLAEIAKCNFISVKGPELLSMWFGESESNIRDVFAKARAASPCILFFDEMDAIAKTRKGGDGGAGAAGDRVINQLLTEMDGIGPTKAIFSTAVASCRRTLALSPALPGELQLARRRRWPLSLRQQARQPRQPVRGAPPGL